MLDLTSPNYLKYFPKNMVFLYTRKTYSQPLNGDAYKLAIRHKDDSIVRLLLYSPSKPEWLVLNLLRNLTARNRSVNVLGTRNREIIKCKPHIRELYQTPIDDLKERLLMQKVLNQPLIEIFERVEI